MTMPPGAGGGIRIGAVTGNVQFGDNASASYTQYVGWGGEPARSPEAERLLAAVEELRERLRSLPPGGIDTETAQLAEEALGGVEDVVPASGAVSSGRLRLAVATVAGMLSHVPGVAAALTAVQSAAAALF